MAEKCVCDHIVTIDAWEDDCREDLAKEEGWEPTGRAMVEIFIARLVRRIWV